MLFLLSILIDAYSGPANNRPPPIIIRYGVAKNGTAQTNITVPTLVLKQTTLKQDDGHSLIHGKVCTLTAEGGLSFGMGITCAALQRNWTHKTSHYD